MRDWCNTSLTNDICWETQQHWNENLWYNQKTRDLYPPGFSKHIPPADKGKSSSQVPLKGDMMLVPRYTQNDGSFRKFWLGLQPLFGCRRWGWHVSWMYFVASQDYVVWNPLVSSFQISNSLQGSQWPQIKRKCRWSETCGSCFNQMKHNETICP